MSKVKVKSQPVEVAPIRVDETVYNELKTLGADMSKYLVKGTRAKTDAKIQAMSAENPELANLYLTTQVKREGVNLEFEYEGDTYYWASTLKKRNKK